MVFTKKYLDFRQLLIDLYNEKSAANPDCTVRKISKAAGYSTPSFWDKVITGKMSLTNDAAINLARFFELNRTETRFFLSLVHYNQAKTEAEKRYHLEEVFSFQQRDPQLLDSCSYKLFSEWYYVALLELIACKKVSNNYSEIANLFKPNITSWQVKKALSVLEHIGLVKKDQQGIYHKIEATITAGEDWKSIAISAYQKKCLELASEALSNVDKDLRNISTLTISISSESFKEIIDEIHLFRKKILSIAVGTQNPSDVYQVNVSVFPLTTQKDRK